MQHILLGGLACSKLLLFACIISCTLAADYIYTHELNWAGGTDDCVQGQGQGSYACTANGTDSGSGDWGGGMKYFVDPSEKDSEYVVKQVNFSLQGSFDCSEAATVTVYLDNIIVATLVVAQNTESWCPTCANSWVSNDTQVAASSKVYTEGWPEYQYQRDNDVYVHVSGVSNKFCLSRITLHLIFATADISDSDSEAATVIAPIWFWTLAIMGVSILMVLSIVFFTLWRRSQSLATSGYNSMGYRPLSTNQFVDPSQLEDIKIDSDQLVLMEEIGRGSFGQVYKGKWRGTDVAVKRIPTSGVQEEEGTREFMKEAFILRQLRHPNIVQVLGASMDPACIVIEFMPRGNLFNIIHDKSVELPLAMVRKITLDICRGMSYLHGCTPPLLHRDLKPHNLLVDDNWRVKVCDFGLSKFVEPQHDMTACGTPAYAAPEVLRNSAYSTSADVYSFAVVLWELLAREPLYPGMPPFQIIFAVGTQRSRPPLGGLRDSATIPPALVTLIQDCWCENPDDRPDFIEITERLEDIDW